MLKKCLGGIRVRFLSSCLFRLCDIDHKIKQSKLFYLINGKGNTEEWRAILKSFDLIAVVPEVIRTNIVFIVSVIIVGYIILRGKVKFVNLVQVEFLFILVVIISIYKRLRIFLLVIILSGVSRIIFILVYVKRTM